MKGKMFTNKKMNMEILGAILGTMIGSVVVVIIPLKLVNYSKSNDVVSKTDHRHNFIERNDVVWSFIPTTTKLAVTLSAFDGGWSLRWDPEFCRATGDGGVDCARGYNEE